MPCFGHKEVENMAPISESYESNNSAFVDGKCVCVAIRQQVVAFCFSSD